jgi:hypothetical protein
MVLGGGNQMYHDIYNIEPRNIKKVIKFASDLYDFQNRNYDGQNPYEYYDVISKYIQIDAAMFIMLSSVSLVYGYRLACISDIQTSRQLVDIISQSNIDIPQTLNGIQSIDENINAFYDIVVALATPIHRDTQLNIITLETLNRYRDIIISNLKNYNSKANIFKIDGSTYVFCTEVLEAVCFLLRSNNTYAVYNNYNIFGLLAEIMLSYVIKLTDDVDTDHYKYVIEQEIPNVMYMYIIPAMCLDVGGLNDVLYLLRRVNSYGCNGAIQ